MKLSKILFLTLFIFLPLISRAETTFSFATDPQSVPIGQISGPIKIQASEKVSETTYLLLTSSSASGQFVSSADKALGSVFVSTGDMSRTIYYKDSAAGDFVITVAVQNKAKTTTLATLTQHIFIGQPASGESTNSETASAPADTQSTDTSSSSTTGAYSSAVPLSTSDEKMEFQISAGRDRLTTVGNNLVFRATATKVKAVPESGITYFWSFGDGTTGQGSSINHAYRFPGEYEVVLNGTYSDSQAVGRAKVKVVTPKVTLAQVAGGVEVSNLSGVEINLEDWRLVTSSKSFVFPADTLIANGKKIIFANETTGIGTGDVALINPIGKEIAFAQGTNPPEAIQVAFATPPNAIDLQAQLDEAKTKLAKLSVQALPKSVPVVPTKPASLPKPTVSKGTAKTDSQTAVVFEAPAQTGIMTSIFSLPVRGFNFIKHFFVED